MTCYRYIDTWRNIYDFISFNDNKHWSHYTGTIIYKRCGYPGSLLGLEEGDTIFVAKNVCIRI